MAKETIVAVYDNEADAAAAVRELEDAGIPSSDIIHHAKDRTNSGSITTPVYKREPGFWARLFGASPASEYDNSVYDQSLEHGSSVVTVFAAEPYANKTSDILERHHPIDIDERATEYRAGQATETPSVGNGDQPMEVVEEKLALGKRAINRGTTRVRRYIVDGKIGIP